MTRQQARRLLVHGEELVKGGGRLHELAPQLPRRERDHLLGQVDVLLSVAENLLLEVNRFHPNVG